MVESQVKNFIPTIIAEWAPHIAVPELDTVTTELINWSDSFFLLFFVWKNQMDGVDNATLAPPFRANMNSLVLKPLSR